MCNFDPKWKLIWNDFDTICNHPLNLKYNLFANWNGCIEHTGQNNVLRKIIETTWKEWFSDGEWLTFDEEFDIFYKKSVIRTPGGASWIEQKEWIENYFKEHFSVSKETDTV